MPFPDVLLVDRLNDSVSCKPLRQHLVSDCSGTLSGERRCVDVDHFVASSIISSVWAFVDEERGTQQPQGAAIMQPSRSTSLSSIRPPTERHKNEPRYYNGDEILRVRLHCANSDHSFPRMQSTV